MIKIVKTNFLGIPLIDNPCPAARKHNLSVFREKRIEIGCQKRVIFTCSVPPTLCSLCTCRRCRLWIKIYDCPAWDRCVWSRQVIPDMAFRLRKAERNLHDGFFVLHIQWLVMQDALLSKYLYRAETRRKWVPSFWGRLSSLAITRSFSSYPSMMAARKGLSAFTSKKCPGGRMTSRLRSRGHCQKITLCSRLSGLKERQNSNRIIT